MLLCVRGTFSAEDVLTDLLAAGTAFGGGGSAVASAHAGMAKAALFLGQKFGGLLCALRDAGHQVTLVGHSLGAGVASLLALVLLEQGIQPPQLRCFAFEPPACMDLCLAERCIQGGLVTSLVHGDDVVPRLAVEPFAELLRQLKVFDWRAEAEREGGGLPPPLAAMQKLSEFFTSKAQDAAAGAGLATVGAAEEAASPSSDGGALKQEATAVAKYNPFVPGFIVYLGTAGFSPAAAPESSGQGAAQSGGPVRVVLPPTSLVLRQIRLTSRMVSDHFIDKEPVISAL